MHLRRSLALTTGALVLALGGLTSCGFDLATDRPYQPGEGTNDKAGDVDVLAAVVVAKQPNEGTVVVTLVNSTADEQALSGVTGTDLVVPDFEPIDVPPRGYVNLADDGGVLVSGDFDYGDLLPLTFTFANGDTASFDVPVVSACGTYLDKDLTEDSKNIPYDCDFEPEPVGGE
jgi:copper(I)-binding protein